MISSFFNRKNTKSPKKKKAASSSKRAPRRQTEKKPFKQRLKLWGIIGVSLCVAVISIIAYIDGWISKSVEKTSQTVNTFFVSSGFIAKDVYLNGHNQVTAEEIVKCLDLKKHKPLTAMNLAETKSKIESLPWVASVSLQRRYPHTLFINLQEKKAVALWQNNKKFYLIDESGKVITSSLVQGHDRLPVVIGNNAPQHAPQLLKRLDSHPDIIKKAKAFIRYGDRRWDIHYKNGQVIKLPPYDEEDALDRLRRFEKKKNIASQDIQIIDLRSPNQLVIKLTPAARRRLSAKDSHA